MLVSGAHAGPPRFYQPVERVFRSDLPELERFCSFDRAWDIFEGQSQFYWWRATEPGLTERLRRVAWEAYAAVSGTGYGRVDLRLDDRTGELFVLEVNSQPGLSSDPDEYSVGYIFQASGVSFAAFIGEQLRAAGCRI